MSSASGIAFRHQTEMICRFREGIATPEELKHGLALTWNVVHRGFVDGKVEVSELVQMFEQAGFVSNVSEPPIPEYPIRLYRGATREKALGLSWTPDIEVTAFYLLTSLSYDLDSYIWETTVDASQLLGAFTGEGMAEGSWEYIVNPETLTWDTVHAIPVDLFEEIIDRALSGWMIGQHSIYEQVQ